MDYKLLTASFQNLHFPDPGLFRQIGLVKLQKRFDAYPFSASGAKLCVLLPVGLRPREAAQLNELTARQANVVVLKEDGARWAKVWPLSAASLEAPIAADLQTADPAASGDGDIVFEE